MTGIPSAPILYYMAVVILSIVTTARIAAQVVPEIEAYQATPGAYPERPGTDMRVRGPSEPNSRIEDPLKVVPYEARKGLFFLRNPLHLFYPYRTSEDDMRVTADMQAAFVKSIQAGVS